MAMACAGRWDEARTVAESMPVQADTADALAMIAVEAAKRGEADRVHAMIRHAEDRIGRRGRPSHPAWVLGWLAEAAGGVGDHALAHTLADRAEQAAPWSRTRWNALTR